MTDTELQQWLASKLPSELGVILAGELGYKVNTVVWRYPWPSRDVLPTEWDGIVRKVEEKVPENLRKTYVISYLLSEMDRDKNQILGTDTWEASLATWQQRTRALMRLES